MVKENTHLLIANNVYNKIKDEKIKSIMFSHLKEYYLGSVVIDSYFYLKKYIHISEKIHGKHGELTNSIILDYIESIKAEENVNNDLCLIFGLITHMATDITFHPAVFNLAGNYLTKDKKKYNKVMHKHLRIETYIDKKINHEFYLREVIDPYLIKGTKYNQAIAKLLSKEIDETEKITLRCLKKQVFYDKIITSGFIYFFACIMDKLGLLKNGELGLFYADVKGDLLDQKIKYQDPISGKNILSSLDILSESSATRAEIMINQAYLYYSGKISRKECEKVIDGASLHTGLANKGVKEMKHFS